jgi:hypothetical protein
MPDPATLEMQLALERDARKAAEAALNALIGWRFPLTAETQHMMELVRVAFLRCDAATKAEGADV